MGKPDVTIDNITFTFDGSRNGRWADARGKISSSSDELHGEFRIPLSDQEMEKLNSLVNEIIVRVQKSLV